MKLCLRHCEVLCLTEQREVKCALKNLAKQTSLRSSFTGPSGHTSLSGHWIESLAVTGRLRAKSRPEGAVALRHARLWAGVEPTVLVRSPTGSKKAKSSSRGLCLFGAGDRTRTGTLLPAADFESATSTNFITPAYLNRNDYTTGASGRQGFFFEIFHFDIGKRRRMWYDTIL